MKIHLSVLTATLLGSGAVHAAEVRLIPSHSDQTSHESSSQSLIAQSASKTLSQLETENQELKARIERLEKLLDVKPTTPATTTPTALTAKGKSNLPIIPKNGVYIQGDLGGQYRDIAGENGYTVTSFQSGFYGNAGVGYRFNKNFRFSGEYANLSSNVNQVAACYGAPSSCGTTTNDGTFFTGQGAITLNQYTFNAYYDADGFGYRKRYRPYVGIGVGTQKSSIIQLSNTQAAPYGLYANGETWAPLTTFSAGLSYLVSKNAEVFMGGKFALGTELLFQNTAFGDLLPQSSRNWIVNGGFRYTF